MQNKDTLYGVFILYREVRIRTWKGVGEKRQRFPVGVTEALAEGERVEALSGANGYERRSTTFRLRKCKNWRFYAVYFCFILKEII